MHARHGIGALTCLLLVCCAPAMLAQEPSEADWSADPDLFIWHLRSYRAEVARKCLAAIDAAYEAEVVTTEHLLYVYERCFQADMEEAVQQTGPNSRAEFDALASNYERLAKLEKSYRILLETSIVGNWGEAKYRLSLLAAKRQEAKIALLRGLLAFGKDRAASRRTKLKKQLEKVRKEWHHTARQCADNAKSGFRSGGCDVEDILVALRCQLKAEIDAANGNGDDTSFLDYHKRFIEKLHRRVRWMRDAGMAGITQLDCYRVALELAKTNIALTRTEIAQLPSCKDQQYQVQRDWHEQRSEQVKSRLERLGRKRLRVATAGLKMAQTEYAKEGFYFDRVVRALEELGHAEFDMAGTPAEGITLLEKHLERMKSQEQQTKKTYDENTLGGSPCNYLLIKLERLADQINLLRARLNTEGVKD